MKKKFNEFEDFDNEEKGKLLQIVFLVIGIIILIALFFVIKNTIFSSEKVEEVKKEVVVEQETEIVEETEEIEEIEVADPLPTVAADIADMEDVNDPQAEAGDGDGNQGASVDTEASNLFINDFETSGLSYGIDVSKYQGGDINWQQVKDSGVEFAIIRVGYRTAVNGAIYEDPCAKYNLQQATAVGINVGVYFFSTAITTAEAEEEAAWVSGFIAPYSITYPVAYNCEGFTDSANRQYPLSQTERTDIAIAFLDVIENAGYTPMFYSSKNEMQGNANWDTDRLSSRYKIWVAQYPELPYPETPASAYTGTHAMWQFTSQGKIPGISKTVDINVAYFGYSQTAQAKDTTTPVEIVAANPEIGITFTEVNETVTAKEKTNLRNVPSSASTDTIVATLVNGDTANRTGIGSNGWSRVIYNGQTLYAVTSYLTTNLNAATSTETTPTAPVGPVSTQVNEIVTAKNSTNLRSTPDQTVSDNIVAVLTYGVTATRTGIRSDGWSIVTYLDQTLYAVTNYITTDLNYQATITPTKENPETIYTFTQVADQVTPKIEVNLRNVPSTASDDTIVAKAVAGEVLERTGIGSNGWSRIQYGDQVLYAVSSYLNKVE